MRAEHHYLILIEFQKMVLERFKVNSSVIWLLIPVRSFNFINQEILFLFSQITKSTNVSLLLSISLLPLSLLYYPTHYCIPLNDYCTFLSLSPEENISLLLFRSSLSGVKFPFEIQDFHIEFCIRHVGFLSVIFLFLYTFT